MRFGMLIFFVMLIISLQCSWVDVHTGSSNRFDYEQLTRGEIELTFHLDGFEMEQLERDGEQYQRISHPESGSLLETGMPDLPVFTILLAIPGRGMVELDYATGSAEKMSGIKLYPQENWQDRGDASSDQFNKNEEYYRSGRIYPETSVTTSGAAIMRDLRILPVSVTPMQYNAAREELEIYNEITIHITVSGNGGVNEKDESSIISRVFEPIYRSSILNYADFIGRPSYQQPTLLFVIRDMTDALEALEYLKDWKVQKGFNVVVATTSETGTTNTSIKSYIQNAYDNWENPPEYVCFCGDGSGTYSLPTWGQGDHSYAILDGTDLLEDVMLGRLPFQNISTFQVLISKIFSYEKYPYMDDTDWYSEAVLAGDPSLSGPSMVFTCQSVKELMLDYPDNFNENDCFTEIYSGSFSSQINNAINSGVSYMVYRGYLGMSGWGPGGQNNGYMMPFATLFTCATGSWVSGTADSEEFMQMGTTTLPNGAIGAVGTATAGTHSCFNNAMTLGVFGSIFRDDVFTMGGALMRGKYYLYWTFPQNPSGYVGTFSEWNTLMGDPSLELWTDVPEDLNVINSSTIATGSNYLPVTVRSSTNEPLEGAWVTLTNEDETFFTTEFCNTAGEVLLDLDGAGEGEYDLVVTYHDFIPHLATIEIAQEEQYVDFDSVVYDDSETGNNNGELNPGETLQVIPVFHNYGSSSVSNVVVDFSLMHGYMSLYSDEMVIGDIAAGGIVSPESGIDLMIAEAALDGMQGCLEMVISDSDGNEWTSWHYLNIAGVNLFANAYEAAGGDLEPGVETEIYFTLENLGTMPAENIQAQLVCQNPRLVITDSLGVFGSIAAGEEGDNSGDTFTVMPSVTIIPGTQLEVELHLSNADGYFQVSRIVLPVGEVEVTDPLGPDEYGYWCYDDEDLGYENCPTYNWIEIDPDLGGEGTLINLNDNGDGGDIELIALPDEFTLSFYGLEYDEITVCSNGWIAPGFQEGANFMNHAVPGPEGPSPMIAAFWDDLDVNSGNVCWYFDEAEHYVVVEWSECDNGDTGSEETFEIILYDPNYYQTMTDDCLIKMQYKTITNNNAGSYPSNHGQYCTVGLENETSLIGLQYTFNNTYPMAAKHLENEMAILFSPPQYPEFGPYLEMVAFDYLSGDDEFIEAGETVVLSVLIGNQGAEEANGVEVELEITDPYFTVVDGAAYIENIEPLGTFQLTDEFSFSVSDQVPDDYHFSAVLNMTTTDDFWFTTLNFTAHWTNAFLVDQDSIDVLLGLDLNTQRTFTITNVSAQDVNFYLSLDDGQTGRDISGSYVSCNTSVYFPGETATWGFTALNNSSSNEWVRDIWLDFPPGVTVLSANGAYGGSGGNLNWDGTTGDGVTVNWHGQEPNGWGVLRDGETAIWNVNVELGENFASDIQVGWQIDGDGYGAEPHSASGELNFDFYITWIGLNTSFGTIAPGESEEITIYYDTHDMEIGDYNCIINIFSDSWFAEVVETNLTVVAVGENDNTVPDVTSITGICPNPFNPSTEIRFELAQSGYTELEIYNMRGQKVKTLLAEELHAGAHKLIWDGRNERNQSVGSGMYYLSLSNASNVLTKKMILLK
ncbi:MAG: T9SS type A sorting domain-containing protein [Candidatus Cloacimonetes bacterium]|nr:T9SS type A sorting domain-containing protein [Candidatus Cloacimonadota bacterium]